MAPLPMMYIFLYATLIVWRRRRFCCTPDCKVYNFTHRVHGIVQQYQSRRYPTRGRKCTRGEKQKKHQRRERLHPLRIWGRDYKPHPQKDQPIRAPPPSDCTSSGVWTVDHNDGLYISPVALARLPLPGKKSHPGTFKRCG